MMELKYQSTRRSVLSDAFNKIKLYSKHPFFAIILMGTVFVFLQLISAALPFIPSTYFAFFSKVFIYYIISLGFLILLGYTGLASLGTSSFVALGGFVVGVLYKDFGVSAEISMVLGIITAVLLGVAIGFISLRVEGIYLAILTLAISEMLSTFFLKSAIVGQDKGISLSGGIKFLGMNNVFGTPFSSFYYIIIILTVLLMIWAVNIIKSPTGRAFLAIKNSSSAAQAMGISLLKYRIMAFVIATLFAVFGGMLWMINETSMVSTDWNLNISLNILAVVVIGGMKSIWGVFAASFIIFGLKDLVLAQIIERYNLDPQSYLLFNGALIIVMIMFYPGGIAKLFTDVKNLFVKLFKKIRSIYREVKYGKDYK